MATAAPTVVGMDENGNYIYSDGTHTTLPPDQYAPRYQAGQAAAAANNADPNDPYAGMNAAVAVDPSLASTEAYKDSYKDPSTGDYENAPESFLSKYGPWLALAGAGGASALSALGLFDGAAAGAGDAGASGTGSAAAGESGSAVGGSVSGAADSSAFDSAGNFIGDSTVNGAPLGVAGDATGGSFWSKILGSVNDLGRVAGAASNSAANQRNIDSQLGLRANEDYNNQLLDRAGLQAKQERGIGAQSALIDILSKPHPTNMAPPSASVVDAAKSNLSTLQNSPYRVANMAPLTPYQPKQPSFLEQAGNDVGIAGGILPIVSSFFK